ncbi:uncharacterized protein B0H18DRAFT_50802 [Fomitopsis serialis]|uniref:uncharacterized protein n=1 Tax=Fomitopsis serialis TaxID=139415 RepID=UPI0020078413|nr:uncharacterized protein B0H18DRAFT_50802 [Neoantrodia serialis]KAH9932212.1 hypothetical protein B0H18DRAFT_50802 [Neoantrodia serialis]
MTSEYFYYDEVTNYLLANHPIDIPYYSLPPNVEDVGTLMGMVPPGYGPSEMAPYLIDDPGLYNDPSYPNPNSGPYTEGLEYDLQYASEAEQLASASHQQSADVEAPPDAGNGHTDHTSSEPGPAHAHDDQASTVAGGVIAAMPAICHFGGLCGSLDSDVLLKKTAGVEKHLLECHWATSALSTMKDRYGKFICQWDDGHGRCGKDVSDRRQMAKHIATVHYQLFKTWCGGCEKEFSRIDSLRRHEREGRCLRGQVSGCPADDRR